LKKRFEIIIKDQITEKLKGTKEGKARTIGVGSERGKLKETLRELKEGRLQPRNL